MSPRGPQRLASSGSDAEVSAFLNSTARLAAAVNRSARLAQEAWGLTAAQHFVLTLLAEAPPQSVSDLAARTGTHQSTVSVVVSRLVMRGLVARSTDVEDGRRVMLTLTAAGRAFARRTPPAAYSRVAEALRALPQRERRQLVRSLARLVDQLAETGQAGGVLEESELRPRIARRDRRRR